MDTINPSRIAFDKNRDNVFLIHDLENPKKRLHVTKTFGQTFGVVQDYVRNFFFDEAGEKLYVERIQPDVSGEILFFVIILHVLSLFFKVRKSLDTL